MSNLKSDSCPKSIRSSLDKNYYFRICPPYWILNQKEAALFSLSHVSNCLDCREYWEGTRKTEREEKDNSVNNIKIPPQKNPRIDLGQLWFLDQNLEGWDLTKRNFMRFFKSPLVLVLDIDQDQVEVGLVCHFKELGDVGDVFLESINGFVESWNVFWLPAGFLKAFLGRLEGKDLMDRVKYSQKHEDKTLRYSEDLFKFRELELNTSYFFRKKAEK